MQDSSIIPQEEQRAESGAANASSQAAAGDGDPSTPPWWQTPASEYVSRPAVDPSIYGIDAQDFAVSDDRVTEIASAGLVGPPVPLPHLETIQRAFGCHDVSQVSAHVGGEAAAATSAFGANAFAIGNDVAFARSPDLHTAAHEATHTIQQRNGAVAFQGLGQRGDTHEQQADTIADAVVAGHSVEHMLDSIGQRNDGARSSASPVQRDERPAMPVFGFPVAMEGKNTKEEEARIARQQELNGYKSKPGPIVRDDEKPVLWGMNPRMPPTPPKPYVLTVDPVLPQWITWTGDPEFGRRNVYWQQFAEAVVDGNQRHARMIPALTHYRNAQKDPRLGALGIRVGDSPADVRSLTESQRVPNEGGADVGSLFIGDEGDLALEERDQIEIEAARDAVLGGRGSVQATGDKTHLADLALDKANARARRAAAQARAAAHELQAALRRVDAIFARKHADEAKRELEDARRRVENARGVVEGLFNVAALVAHIAEEGVGDAIEKAGELVSGLISLSEQGAIEKLGRDLELAELKHTTLLDEGTIADYNGALERADAARDGIDGARMEVLGALGGRRDAYNTFGASAQDAARPQGESSTSNERGRSGTAKKGKSAVTPPIGDESPSGKLAAILSAIPLVEEARDQARALVRDGEGIPMSESATRGCGIASAHGHPVVAPFLAVANELHAVESLGRRDATTWTERLQSLEEVKTYILGKKAGE